MQNQHRFNQDGLVRVWPNACGLEASQCAGIIGPGLWQDTTGLLPVFHSQTQLHSSTDVPDHIMQNQPGSDLILAGRIKFWPKMGLVRKQASVQETSGQCFQADLDWKCELDPTRLLGYMHVLQFMPSTVPFRLGFRPLC